MKIRNIIQFVVFPKFFSVISFYSKGHYSLSLKLCTEDQNGRIISAYPIIYEGRDANKMDFKRASIEIVNSVGKYTTQQFYVTYSQESILLNTLCIFKVQYQTNKKYKTYIDIDLNFTRFKILSKVQQRQKSTGQLNKRITTVDNRRIYINRHQQLNVFKRLIFPQSQYFSFIDLYIGSTSLGSKIRNHNYQLCQFLSYPTELRQQFHLQTQQKQLSKQQLGKIIREQLQTQAFDISGFYEKLVISSVKEYERLIGIYNSTKIKMLLIQSNSQIMQKIKIPALTIFQNYKNKDALYQHYGYCSEYHTNEIYYDIFAEYCDYSKNVLYIWQQFTLLLIKMNLQVFETMIIHQQKSADHFLKQTAIITDKQIVGSSRFRQQQNFVQKRQQVIENQLLYEDIDAYHPLLMIQGHLTQNINKKQQSQIQSLTVFVHGYQGSDFDVEKARNFMWIYNRYSHGLLIKSIQDQQEGDIEKSGKLVAEEIILHLKNVSTTYKKINFLGYSLGGVIARQCLKYLTQYKSMMNIFISFASPHLGVRNSPNSLVNTGIWYLVNISKVKTMRQLNCDADQNNEFSLLENLANCQCLSWFKKVVVVSSLQDHFVPHYSSRLEQLQNCSVTSIMAKNIKQRIKKLQRVEVWFDVQHDIGTWDKFLGRRAHIQFLQNRGFLDSFFKLYGPQL